VGLLAAALLLGACGQDDKPAPGAATAPSAPTASAPAPAQAPPSPAASSPAPQAQPPHTPAPPGKAATAAAGDPEKGRQVYLGQCVACHNRDPAKDGPLGPAVKGSPPELVEARVVRGEYPTGYTPKRPSKVMPVRPDLAPSIPDLAVYLR
jgi:mono/diheme cytochrome c family protein